MKIKDKNLKNKKDVGFSLSMRTKRVSRSFNNYQLYILRSNFSKNKFLFA